ncbi:MAG: tryptophan--tRNA ligase [Elusimicrobiota bacterium]|nr:tryptophan--tRNA ligase [Elusimicrobiota bacterium]
MKSADVVFSGMRPTGRLHLGNYWGALHNWVGLQSRFTSFFCVVDWHMLTTGFEDTSKLQENSREMVLDWLAAGLDPQKAVVFKQSDVPEHAELALMLSMVTPLSWLENNPTWKEQLQELAKTKAGLGALAALEGAGGGVKTRAETIEEQEQRAAAERLRSHGFIGYPVLQAADILLYRGTKVPVGQDQLPHVELSRQIARRFNQFFGEVFPEPQPLLTPSPKVPGLDGRKMSKSYANAIDIFETAPSLEKKVKGAYTDPNRKSATDPGHPLPCPENPPGCSVYALHKLYADEAFYARRGDECRAGALGCGACKKDLLASMEPAFADFRARRAAYDAKAVDRVLAEGAEKARAVARKTMDEVRRAMRLR